jgi:hypothetical protein
MGVDAALPLDTVAEQVLGWLRPNGAGGSA